ncbi:PREDICTED: uncharacterized protein LOC108969829 [Bactrocera latifrons]|uniref:Uncharacterized protein n=1 Tax=Bactrocera latifrons TaxID=174628 RepID=A0A0K8V3K4_BACLA|nr:PREDICTED: uncharacterized protein LOC108969829 [Bactrocera latifrons]
MSIKRAQYDSKCYCSSAASTCCSNTHANCIKRKTTGSGSIFSVASKRDKQIFNTRTAAKNRQNTDFVKIKRKTTLPAEVSKNRRGLGHTNLHCTTNFSRRNSAATTVTFSTPCATPASFHSSNAIAPSFETPSPSPLSTILKNLPVSMSTLGDNFSALSVSSKSDRGSDCGDTLPHEYTEQRRYYESAKQLMKLISAQGDNYAALNLISGSGVDGIAAAACVRDAEVEAERLRQLQEFRLQNAEDCFNVHRRLDLHLPMHKNTLTPGGMEQLVCKLQRETLSTMQGKMEGSDTKGVKSAVVKENAKKSQLHNSAITPYAVRQRLLKLRLEAEELKRAKPGPKYRPLEKSCALRYQETY